MKKPRGRVEPVVPKGIKLGGAIGYTQSVERDTAQRSRCADEGHATHLFSRFCTRCGWILTDEEVAQLE